jgi:hypothetical protein
MSILVPTSIGVNGTTYRLISLEDALSMWLPETRDLYVWIDSACAGPSRGCSYVLAGTGAVTGIELPADSMHAVTISEIEIAPRGIPGTPVPEPGTWLLMAVGIACLRVFLRGKGARL